MTHADVVQRDLADRYVRNDLAADQAREFEEHYFTCDACFGEVQAAERLRASVRDLSARGGLDDEVEVESIPSMGWRRSMFGLALAASLVLAIATGWLGFVVVPGLRSEVAAERDGRQTDARLRVEREQALARQQREGGGAAETQMALAAEPNIPVAILSAMRGAADTAVTVHVPAYAQHLVLWIDTPGTAAGTLRLTLTPVGSTTPIRTIDGLRINSVGALSVAVPATVLAPGSYIARLFGDAGGRQVMAGEYRFTITRSR